jgi:hypothetical protein
LPELNSSAFPHSAELAALRRNAKAFGELLATLYQSGLLRAQAESTQDPFRLSCRVPRVIDFETAWLRDACRALQIEPRLHRQVWEYAFVWAALHRLNLLRPGLRALGVATHEDPFASCLAQQGVEVVLAEPGDLSTALESAFRPSQVGRKRFEAMVTIESPGSGAWPASWKGQFDICWTTRALERQQSVQGSLSMARSMVSVLRPGGAALITTEFSLGLVESPSPAASLCILERSHLDLLAQAFTASGFALAPLELDWGNTVLDAYIDVPPYPGDPGGDSQRLEPPHLKMLIDGIAVTRIALLLLAGSPPQDSPATLSRQTHT